MTSVISIDIPPEYQVHLGHAPLADLGTFPKWSECAVVTDANVAPLMLQKVKDAISKLMPCSSFIVPAGERHKSLAQLQEILGHFAASNLTRSGGVIALGGGVIGDMAGFASAIWLRGVPVVQMPTTLLSMVDSSVGGKTAVDIQQGKNLVGAFHQPVAVYADMDALSTLDKTLVNDGIAEMLKMGVISTSKLFDMVASGKALCEEAIALSIQCKADIVKQDPLETGIRKLLNLGHTSGHAIEKLSNFTISHGQAVAMGMAMAANAGLKHGITEPDCRNAIITAMDSLGLPSKAPFPVKDIVNAMATDKKRAGSSISLIIPVKIGECRIVKVGISQLMDFWS